MRKEVQACMEAELKQAESNRQNSEDNYNADVERIKKQAEDESFFFDVKESGEKTHAIYQSYIDAGFTEVQAWELVKIIVSNAATPKRT